VDQSGYRVISGD